MLKLNVGGKTGLSVTMLKLNVGGKAGLSVTMLKLNVGGKAGSLTHNKLSGSIPTEMGKLHKLKHTL
ncbi:hypothetical protein CYMTET_35927 [Cymbomonas tetramitiformis]|uniref:Uncharacterized protein n=1 Tax=Cymbomonas tetramitiformis TaxID=36881 RepID=A0AAE0F8B4_9CHLO|nr:hypothetical protein CYMTET_35927 [Cymbomonas tetramitiformis]